MAFAAKGFGSPRIGRRDAEALKQRLVTDGEVFPFDGAYDALSGYGLEVSDSKDVQVTLISCGDDRVGKRMFAGFFKASNEL